MNHYQFIHNMLQADEIIQQKEWHQLDALEKAVIAELADNETEFNLLKKMLMVSSGEVSEVPQVAVSVQEQIRSALPVVKKISSHRNWYAVAAAILVMIIATIFFLKKENKNEDIPFVKKNIKNPVTDSMIKITQDTSILLVKKEKITEQKKKSSPSPAPVFHSLKDTSQDNYAGIDATVSSNMSLIDLITEVE